MTDAAAPRRRHRALPGSAVDAPSIAASVVPGPIAVLPDGDATVEAAVVGAGGTVAPLDDATRGIVWTASSGAGELEAVLDGHPDVSWVQLPWAGVDAFAGVLRRFAGDGRVWTSAKGAYAQPGRRARAHARPRGAPRGPATGASGALGGRRARTQPLRRRRGHRGRRGHRR